MKKKVSKRYKKLIDIFKVKKIETLEETIKKVKESCTAKFDESIDVSLNLNLKQKKEEISIRTLVNLPNGNGKKIKIAVLCEENKINEAYQKDINDIRRSSDRDKHKLEEKEKRQVAERMA